MATMKQCPRCGENHLEVFRSHEYCANCNYGVCFVGRTFIRQKYSDPNMKAVKKLSLQSQFEFNPMEKERGV